MAAVIGTAGNDTLVGTDDADSINGRAGADKMTGGAGGDTYYVDNVGDSIIEGANGGDDKVYVTGAFVLANGQHVETLRAFTDASVSITGNELANAIYGRAGDDHLVGGLGDDYLSGGVGVDELVGGWGNDTILGGDDNDALYGLDNADTLYGGAGEDQLFGGTGNDYLDGGLLGDAMVGGFGSDIYIVESSSDYVSEAAETGIDVVRASIDYILTANVENLTLGGNARRGTGNTSNNTITGTSGDDFLYGLGGNDYLVGGVGNDYLEGGDGTNKLDGGVGNDTYFLISEGNTILDGSGNDTVILDWNVTYFAAGNVALETIKVRPGHDGGSFYAGTKVGTTMIGGGGQEFLHGNILNDVLISGGGNDYLFGGKGNDVLDARGAGAWLEGGLGNDTYLVDVPSQFVELAGGGIDTVRSWSSIILEDFFEVLILEGSGNIDAKVTDTAMTNVTITGNSGANIISGAWGNDKIKGGAGADTFRISDPFQGNTENDSYLDMSFAEGDRFDLSTVDADIGVAGNNAFHWVSNFTGQAGEARLYHNATHTSTFLQLDIDGDQQADYQASFKGYFTTAQTLTGSEPAGVGGWLL